MTDQVLDADPQGAFAWAATISDTESRDLEVSNLARRWLREDPAAARKWIAGSGLLTAEQKAELLKRE